MAEKYNPLEQEQEMLKFWKENNTYSNIKNKNKINSEGKREKQFYFLDGPPYTSGKVHIGTAWNKSLKDMVLRFKRMKGLDVWDRAGYDMHGLPTENATQKKLNLTGGKQEIVKYGVDKFISECKQLCIDNMESMNQDFERLGVWMDFSDPYQSINNDFIDGEWWLIKKAHENGRLYRGLRTMTWCPITQSALAKHELEYQEVTDTSIFVKFKVTHDKTGKDISEKNEYLIIWTTTPWTIPFNLAVMVNPNLEYVKVKVKDETWILAKDLANLIIQNFTDEKYVEIERFLGEKLEGIKYLHFWNDVFNYKNIECKNPDNMHTVILSKDFVDTSAGSGLVHCAPGCGPEDYEVGYQYGLPAFNTIDEKGFFPEDSGFAKGLQAKKNDNIFIEQMEKDNVLIAKTPIEHEYPHDWRHHNPVIFRTTKQWFFKIEDFKDKLISENDKTTWVPNAAYNAFNSWLNNLRDNSISKQRFWGTPIPIWMNEDNEEDYIVIGSIQELEEMSGMKVDDPHLPHIDKIVIKKDGKTYRRIPDILDVWVDAGTASWNCLYYPKRTDLFDNLFPADFILEGKDQIRGWFNLLHIASMVSMNRPSFKNVYMHGFVQDSKGRKMSKSLGNYILPKEVIDKHGADTFRYYMIGGANPGIDINYNPEDVEQKNRNLNVLWNVHNFIVDFFTNNSISYEDALRQKDNIQDFDIEEKYMLSVLNSSIEKITEKFELYNLNEVPILVENLFLELSRGYIQLIRDKSVQGTENEKLQIAYTLSESILSILKLLAPVCPFITEKMYQNIKKVFLTNESSIHEFNWPVSNGKLVNKDLELQIQEANSIIQGILAAREKAQLGVRWPILKAFVETKKSTIKDTVKEIEYLIKNQTNIKQVLVVEKMEGIKLSFKPNYGKLAKFCGQNTQPVAQELIEKSNDVISTIQDKGKFVCEINEEKYDILLEHLDISREVPENMAGAEFKEGMIYLDTTRTEDLEIEGFSREIIRRVQTMRKDNDMVKSDTIELFISVPKEMVESMQQFSENIRAITGAKKLTISSETISSEYSVKTTFKIKGKEFEASFNKL